MLTCKICVMTRGFSLSDTDRIFKNEDQLADHLENEHGIPVIREGETDADASKRCAKKGIVPDTSKCKCGDCKRKRGKRKEMVKQYG